MKRWLPLLALPALLVLVVVLRWPPSYPPEPPQPLAGQAWAETACWFRDGWFERSHCAWLFPSRQDSAAQTALPVVRLQREAWRPSRRATVFLSGGPGGSSYLFDEAMPFWREWMDRLALDHDLILYDQRGTGLARPFLQCPELDTISRALLKVGLDVDAQWRELEPVILDCAEQVSREDRAAGLYSTATAAQDLRELIAAVQREWGYAEVQVFGVSYGTRLAVEALAQPMPGVSRVVLDSYYPAQVDLMLAFPASFARLLQDFDARCRLRPDCELAESPLREVLAQALAAAEAEPRRIEAPDELDGGRQTVLIDAPTLMSLVEHALYADADVAALAHRLQEFLRGELGEEWETLVSGWLWASFDPEFSLLTHLLVECRDNPPSRAEDELSALANFPDWLTALRRPRESFVLCERLGVAPAPLPKRAHALPTLLLAAEFDPRTPSDIALREAQDFARTHRLVLPIAGHSVVDFDDCAAQAAGAFLNRADLVPATRCAALQPAAATAMSTAE